MGPSINDVTLSDRFLTPPLRHTASQKVKPLKYDFTKLKSEKMLSLKINMFRINLIVVRVEGENNYMRRRWKGEISIKLP